MARRMRPSPLSLKLDVIVEEDFNSIGIDFNLSTECPPPDLLTAQHAGLCLVTLQDFHQPLKSEPQFLHIGKWPGADMLDDMMLESASPSTQNSSPTETDMSIDSLENDMAIRPLPIDSYADEWRAVTADQLSMVMDCWDPNEHCYPFSTGTAVSIRGDTTMKSENHHTITAIQQSLFLEEIMDEYITRVQTVEHIEELEDNDNVMEIVATLEGYRQNGWATEMTEAFPRECWLFWSSSGIATKAYLDHNGVCDDHGISILGA